MHDSKSIIIITNMYVLSHVAIYCTTDDCIIITVYREPCEDQIRADQDQIHYSHRYAEGDWLYHYSYNIVTIFSLLDAPCMIHVHACSPQIKLCKRRWVAGCNHAMIKKWQGIDHTVIFCFIYAPSVKSSPPTRPCYLQCQPFSRCAEASYREWTETPVWDHTPWGKVWN